MFVGWTKNNDESKVYTNDEIAAMEITADTTFTAKYENNKAYCVYGC